VCSATGEEFNHSMEELLLLTKIGEREVETASQIIHINIITETKEINDPREETTFQVVKASG
jgi:hypothetical protein